MPVFKFTGEAEIYNQYHAGWLCKGILPVYTTELADNETEAMRAVSRGISSIYSDDWRWLWWQALPAS